MPGSGNYADSNSNWKMVGTAIYTFVGMAIMSMAFSLIQDQMIIKFQWITDKILHHNDDRDKKDSPENDLEYSSETTGNLPWGNSNSGYASSSNILPPIRPKG